MTSAQIAERFDSICWPLTITKPNIDDYHILFLDGESAADQVGKKFCISNKGFGNILLFHKSYSELNFSFNLSFSGDRNLFLIDECSSLSGSMFCGNDCTAVMMGHQDFLRIDAGLYDGGTLLWGRGSRAHGCRIWTDGGNMVSIGDDCLFSERIEIRTSDHHSVIDLETMAQTNFPKDVSIGKHVWISPGVSIFKGVTIGSGSIVGLGSIVSKDIGETELWAGIPASLVKTKVSWVDSHPAKPTDLDRMREILSI